MSNITDLLKQKDELELKILGPYVDKLTQVFQLAYNVDDAIANVMWTRISRYSPTSNFIWVSCKAEIPAGKMIGETMLDESMVMDISLTLPMKMMDDGSTPYQLSEASHIINLYRQMSSLDEFVAFMTTGGTIEEIRSAVPVFTHKEPDPISTDPAPKYDPPVKVEKKKVTVPPTAVSGPEFLWGFDLTDLTDEQRKQLTFSNLKLN